MLLTTIISWKVKLQADQYIFPHVSMFRNNLQVVPTHGKMGQNILVSLNWFLPLTKVGSQSVIWINPLDVPVLPKL